MAQLDAVWVADLTYIPTREGWLYLTVILDFCSRRVIGWQASRTPDVRLSLGALEMALGQRRCRHNANSSVCRPLLPSADSVPTSRQYRCCD